MGSGGPSSRAGVVGRRSIARPRVSSLLQGAVRSTQTRSCSRILQPAALRVEIGKMGWHTLRHSFATALDAAGARAKVAQELMRHANYTTTMDIYTGALERDKRETASRVARVVLAPLQ
ncbi:MAG: tyrosine-type recombinase/integrase [Terriglobales bacterium]